MQSPPGCSDTYLDTGGRWYQHESHNRLKWHFIYKRNYQHIVLTNGIAGGSDAQAAWKEGTEKWLFVGILYRYGL